MFPVEFMTTLWSGVSISGYMHMHDTIHTPAALFYGMTGIVEQRYLLSFHKERCSVSDANGDMKRSTEAPFVSIQRIKTALIVAATLILYTPNVSILLVFFLCMEIVVLVSGHSLPSLPD